MSYLKELKFHIFQVILLFYVEYINLIEFKINESIFLLIVLKNIYFFD
jgi:hypothetical protein